MSKWELHRNCKVCKKSELLDGNYNKLAYQKYKYDLKCSFCGEDAFINSSTKTMSPHKRIIRLKKHIKQLKDGIHKRKIQNGIDFEFKKILKKDYPVIYEDVVKKLGGM